MLKRLAVFLVFVLSACQFNSIDVQEKKPMTNIIFVIGDGMGPAYTSAYRIFKDKPDTPTIEKTIFDQLAAGMATTHPKKGKITDSAAAATALATGFKTLNGYVGVNSNKEDLTTTLEQAKLQGYLTGVIATSTLTHATPASFIANHHNRKNEQKIAKQFLQKNSQGNLKFDLLMGGGRGFFVQKKRNLIDELTAAGFDDVTNFDQLKKASRLPVVALIENSSLAYAINSNSNRRHRLLTMTEKALQLFKKKEEKPFFLVVEGSQIDWCGHGNDIACAMAEMEDFALTIEMLQAYVDKHPNTLLVITADHETGGLNFHSGDAEDAVKWRPDVVRQIKGSAYAIQTALYTNQADWQKVWQQYTAIELNDDKQFCVDGDDNTVDKKLTDKQCIDILLKTSCSHSYETCSLGDKINSIINQRSNTYWKTDNHTGVNVQVFSYGKYSDRFTGNMDNTDIAQNIFSVLNANQ